MADEGSTATVGRRWRLLGYGLLAAAGVYALGEAWRLGLWRQGSPGEGLFSFLTAIGMTGFTALSLAAALRAPEAPTQARPPSRAPAFLCGRLRSARLHHLDHRDRRVHPAFRRALRLDDDDRTGGRHRGRMSSAVRVLAAGDPADRLPVGQSSVLSLGRSSAWTSLTRSA